VTALEGEEGGKLLEMLLDSELKLLSKLLIELGLIEGMLLEQPILLKTEILELLELLEIELFELLEHGRTE